MSAGDCSQPSSINSAIDFSPRPSMSSAPRDTKCLSRSNRCAGQIRPPVQRTSTSPSSATASLSAFGAMVGESVGVARLVAGQVLDHLRDDVAGALDQHPVADPQPKPLDLVAIVERDVGDDHPADPDRLQAPDRGQLAGAADLDVDRLERRLGLLGREFVGERPARRARHLAEPLLPVEPVDLVDDPVDVERAGRPAPSRSPNNGRASRRGSCRHQQVGTGKPKPSIRSSPSNWVSASGSDSLAPAVGEKAQRPGGGDRPRPSGGAIPRPHCADWRKSFRPPPPAAR
jgi:hypothetical protein